MNTISSTNSFSFERFLLLTKRTIILNQKSWVIGFSSAYGILALAWFLPIFTALPVWHSYQINSLLPAATFLFSAGGLFITSTLFDELHSPTTAFLNFTLPATAFEKLFNAWFISFVLFSVTALAGYFVLHLLIQLITVLITSSASAVQPFDPFSKEVMRLIHNYVAYNSVFLLGAVYFKKNNFLKTLLVMILFGVGMAFISGIIAFFSAENSFHISISELNTTVLYLITVGFISLMLFFSYIRLKNRQVA